MPSQYHYLDRRDIEEAVGRYNPAERADYQDYPCFLHDHRNIARKISRPLRDGYRELSRGYKVFFDKYGYATHCRPVDRSVQSRPEYLSMSVAQNELEIEQEQRENRIMQMIWGGNVTVENAREETTHRPRRSASAGASNARVKMLLKYH